MSKNDEDIGTTLARLARVHTSPKALLKAVLDEHPKAKKKDVAHAAFLRMIETADSAEASALQDVGITLRAASD